MLLSDKAYQIIIQKSDNDPIGYDTIFCLHVNGPNKYVYNYLLDLFEPHNDNDDNS